MADQREDVPVEDGCAPECNYIEWSDVVGEITMDSNGEPVYVGGGVNDLLYIARQHLASAKSKGQLTAEEMGKAYAAIIPAAFKEAINFEMAEALSEFKIQNEKADVVLKEAQLESDRNKTEAELEKQWGYDVTRDADGELVLGLSSDEGKIDAETDKIDADVLIAQQEIEIARAKAANEQAQTIANVDKVYGYAYTIVDGALVIGADTKDGKLDYENSLLIEKTESEAMQNMDDGVIEKQILDIVAGTALTVEKTESEDMQNMTDGVLEAQIEKMQADVLIAEQEVLIAQSKESREYVGMIGELDKVLGYDYDLDVDGNVVRDSITDAEDGKIDYENSKIQSEAANENALTIANIEKVYGYDYTTDTAGNITVGTDTADGKLDYDNTMTQTQTEKLVNDTNLSLLSAQLGAWTSSYTSGKLDNRPDLLDNEEIECLYDKILGDVTGDDCENPAASPTPPVVGPGE